VNKKGWTIDESDGRDGSAWRRGERTAGGGLRRFFLVRDESTRLTASRWIIWAARMGHLATGSVYLVVGGVALVASFDFRLYPKGAQEALRVLVAGTPSRWLLIVLAAGLAADFVWQIVRAVFNVDRAPVNLRGMRPELAGSSVAPSISVSPSAR